MGVIVIYPKKLAVSQIACHEALRVQPISFLADVGAASTL